MKRTDAPRLLSLLLALALLLTACAGPQQAAAATMHLRKTEGTVGISDGEGQSVTPAENLGLYSGYQVSTSSESYAWIDLDSVKLTKLDENSEISIRKVLKQLEVEVISGSLFFNVTEPLDENETLNIRTSSLVVGIRGTCGWVTQDTACLLEGTVTVTAGDESVTVNAGEMAVLTDHGRLTVTELTVQDIPGFVLAELEEDEALAQAVLDSSGLDIREPADPMQAAMEQYRVILSQADSYFTDDYDYGDNPPTISYFYALVPMQTAHPVPALILEQDRFSDFFGDFGDALVFQYDPDSEAVIQADGMLNEGVAGAGGYRGMLSMSGDGIGILETTWQSGTGDGSIRKATVDGNSLLSVTVWSGLMFTESYDAVESLPIDWHEITDLSGLDYTPGTAVSPPEPESGHPDAEQPLPTDGDRVVFRGTIELYSYDELVALCGDNPNPGTTQTTMLLLPDEPVTVLVQYPDPETPSESTQARWFKVDTYAVQGLEQYAGQQLVFSIDSLYATTDTSLPFDAPWVTDVRILE